MLYLLYVITTDKSYTCSVDSIDEILEHLTAGNVVDYTVTKGDRYVSYPELASAWRHPARNNQYPPLKPNKQWLDEFAMRIK